MRNENWKGKIRGIIVCDRRTKEIGKKEKHRISKKGHKKVHKMTNMRNSKKHSTEAS